MKAHKGFTLIELLVVIAIIGFLSSIVVVSYSYVRAKARDAQRLSDVKQMNSLLDTENAGNAGTNQKNLEGCAEADSKTVTCSGPGEISRFQLFKDPRAKGLGDACVGGGVASCDYAISRQNGANGNPTVADYQICFYMEEESVIGAQGMYSIEPGGVIVSGCDL